MKVEYGKHFKVKVSRYTDEDFDSANNAVELEIKSSKPILKLAVEKKKPYLPCLTMVVLVLTSSLLIKGETA